tara:strand:- start:3156 stop:4016 length:861 start_codon:yes stop_codon:yes gene_type:complete
MSKEFDMTFLIPGIRTNRWKDLYDSLRLSCKKYDWELVFVGPFDLPEELRNKDDVRLIKDRGQVSRCVQLGVPQINSEIFFIGMDDSIYIEDAFDEAIDKYESHALENTIMQCIYAEGGHDQPIHYWSAAHHDAFKLAGINQNWKLATQPIIHKSYFMELGGFDCRWEYMDKPMHDFMFRTQRDGGEIIYSPGKVANSDWWPDHTGDHGPVHDAEILHDFPIFNEMWSVPNSRIKIDYDNWKDAPTVWKRRFPEEVYDSYEKLWKGEGYTEEFKAAPPPPKRPGEK